MSGYKTVCASCGQSADIVCPKQDLKSNVLNESALYAVFALMKARIKKELDEKDKDKNAPAAATATATDGSTSTALTTSATTAAGTPNAHGSAHSAHGGAHGDSKHGGSATDKALTAPNHAAAASGASNSHSTAVVPAHGGAHATALAHAAGAAGAAGAAAGGATSGHHGHHSGITAADGDDVDSAFLWRKRVLEAYEQVCAVSRRRLPALSATRAHRCTTRTRAWPACL